MFSLPAIGVSACARTIGHATSSSRNSEANLHIMRIDQIMEESRKEDAAGDETGDSSANRAAH